MNPTALAVLPLGSVVLFAVGLLMFDLWKRADPLYWTLTGCVMAIMFYSLAITSQFPADVRVLGGLVHVDGFSALFGTIILIGTALTSLLHYRQAAAQRAVPSADIDVLLLFAAAGGLVMVSTGNLIVFFLGFELLELDLDRLLEGRELRIEYERADVEPRDTVKWQQGFEGLADLETRERKADLPL